MHAISSYRGNRPTNKPTNTHKQTGPITIHCPAKLSAQYNNDSKKEVHSNSTPVTAGMIMKKFN